MGNYMLKSFYCFEIWQVIWQSFFFVVYRSHHQNSINPLYKIDTERPGEESFRWYTELWCKKQKQCCQTFIATIVAIITELFKSHKTFVSYLLWYRTYHLLCAHSCEDRFRKLKEMFLKSTGHGERLIAGTFDGQKWQYLITYGGVEGPPHIFFRHHGISYGWLSNSSVGDSNYCYVIRRTY